MSCRQPAEEWAGNVEESGGKKSTLAGRNSLCKDPEAGKKYLIEDRKAPVAKAR